MNLAGLASCRELTAEHAEVAARSPSDLRAVLARAAELAQPEDGAPMILFVLARLARGDVAWIEGDLTVELGGDDAATTLDIFVEEGFGIRERPAPRTRFAVPLDEFTRAVEISSKRFAPLRATVTADKVVLSSTADDEPSTPLAIPTPTEPEPFSLPGTSRKAAEPAVRPPPAADPVHSRPTVRRMVAIRPEALRTGRKDPRREDDE